MERKTRFKRIATFLVTNEIMGNSREALVVVLSRRSRSRSEQKRVEERYAAGKCLMQKRAPTLDVLVDCDSITIVPATGKRVAPRGCCVACYHGFLDYLKTLPADEAVRAEQEAIARGWILGLQEQRELKTQYAFKRLIG